MNTEQFLAILHGRIRIILLSFVTVMAVTFAVTAVWPRSYKATTSVALNYKNADPVSGFTLSAQLVPGYVATQVDLINSKHVALRVVETLGLQADKQLNEDFMWTANGQGDIREWLAAVLQKRVETDSSRESSVLNISFKHTNPEFAARVANAYATEYRQAAIELKAQPVREASAYFGEQIKTLQNKLESAQKRLTDYQRQQGVPNADPKYDIEVARLNSLSGELVAVQGRLIDAISRSRHHTAKELATNPDVVSHSLVQTLQSLVAQNDARVTQLSINLTDEHPVYQQAKSEAISMRKKLNEAIQAVGSSLDNSVAIQQQREKQLLEAIDEQRSKVLALNGVRDHINVLARQIESAQKAYDMALERFNQTSLEAKANQVDIAIMSPATIPARPSHPNVPMNLAIAAFIGAFLSVGIAIAREMMDRRLRSASDLSQVFDAPMFGAVDLYVAGRRPILGLPRPSLFLSPARDVISRT